MELRGLHFVTGEKGGIGKSLFARVLLEYFNKLSIKYKFYDADRSSPDVGLAYGESYDEIVTSLSEDNISKLDILLDEDNYKQEISNDDQSPVVTTQIYFSEDQRESFRADQLYEEASEGNLVVVNLPAQVELLVNQWLNDRSILSESDFPIYYWFLTDGSPESLDLLQRSLQQYGDKINHIIIRNKGLNKSVDEAIMRSSVFELMRSLKIKAVEMPQLILSDVQMEVVKNSRFTLSQAMDRETVIEGLSSLSRTRIKSFLQQTHIQIDRTGVFAMGEQETEKKHQENEGDHANQ